MPVKMKGASFLKSLICMGLISPLSHAGEWQAEITPEMRLFMDGPSISSQNEGMSPSVSFNAEYEHIDGANTYVFAPFLRIDHNDSDREHADIREAFWLHEKDDYEVKIGLAQVFWGTIESRHLVDVINQTDGVENLDGEAKLGQPMVQLATFKDWGTLRAFVLPGFRERTYPGIEGRLRLLPVGNARFEDNDKRSHIDTAVRYEHVIGDIDLGLAHFSGTSREPTLTLSEGTLIPTYYQMDQTSIDMQLTTESTLYKLEALSRETQGERFEAISAGVEYTFYDIKESGADIGVLLEGHYDNRPSHLPATTFEHDIFLASRIAWNDINDKELLAGVVVDTKTKNRSYRTEYSQRLNNDISLDLEANIFAGQADPFARALGEDDFVQVSLSYYF